MEFGVEKRTSNEENYFRNDIETARKFAKKIYKEMGGFVNGLILFGSAAKKEKKHAANDIDLLMIIDDVHFKIGPDIVETYRIITQKAIADIDTRLHVQTMGWTSFWEFVRAGDPVAINILRDGFALIDTGFFEPLQVLLAQGRIRPSKEAVWTYFTMAPASLNRAAGHIDMAIIDLYWAAIDASHSALMSLGVTPPSPAHVADMIEKKMVKTGMIEKKYADIMRHLYILSKKIIRKEIHNLSGETYDKYKKHSEALVFRMRKFIEEREKI